MDPPRQRTKRFLAPLYEYFANHLPPPELNASDPVDLYGAGMTNRFNWLHRWIFPRFFRKISVDTTPVERLKELAVHGTLIYITPDIGQLEYNFFNYFLLEHRLPLARFVNGLRTTLWRPLHRIREVWQMRCTYYAREDGPIPHPVRSGYVARLLGEHHSALFRLKVSLRYDDLFWEDPAEDPLSALIQTQRFDARPFHLVPMQFLWDRRPERVQKGLIDLLFGERDNPGRLRKFVLFCRNYKTRAMVQIGAPIPLADVVPTTSTLAEAATVRALREHLLRIIRKERQTTTGPALKPRRWILDQVMDAERVQRETYANARAAGKSVEDVQQLARQYANEIAADIHYSYIDFAGWILRWVFRNIYDGFTVDEACLTEVKRSIAEGPTVLVPNHRSHTDYMLLPYIHYINNMMMPHVAGGLNMAFWPAGHFFRRCGAFFLRRSFRKNPLYRAVFEEYLNVLVREAYCTAFFIEGGRSRTGKSLPPKMGMLSMLTQGMREGVSTDLRFIPIAFTYDQVIEQKAYLSELAGGTKPRESGWHLLQLGQYLKRKYGHIYMHCGEPIRFSEAMRTVVPEAKSASDLTDEQKSRVVQHLAQTIMYAINRQAVVTPAALAATALLLPLKRAVTESEVIDTVDQLCLYLAWKGSKLSDPLMTNRDGAIHEALQKFSSGPGRLISLHEEFAPVCYAIDEARRIQLDYSKNTMIHFFVSLGCLAVILRTHFLRGESVVPLAAIEADYARCKQLFRHEFTFSTRFRTMEHVQRILSYLTEAGYVEAVGDMAPAIQITPPGATRLRLFAGLLRNFFESYKVALLAGPQLPTGGIEEKALPKFLIQYGEHLLLLGQIRCPEAISKANLQHAIHCYKEMGFLVEGPLTAKGKPTLLWKSDHPESPTLQPQLEEWC